MRGEPGLALCIPRSVAILAQGYPEESGWGALPTASMEARWAGAHERLTPRRAHPWRRDVVCCCWWPSGATVGSTACLQIGLHHGAVIIFLHVLERLLAVSVLTIFIVVGPVPEGLVPNFLGGVRDGQGEGLRRGRLCAPTPRWRHCTCRPLYIVLSFLWHASLFP